MKPFFSSSFLRNTFLFLTLLFCLGRNCLSQTPVIDVGVISTLVINHTAQQAVLNEIKDSEGEIAAAQKTIAVKMEQIRALEEKVFKSLSTVTSMVRDAKNVVYAHSVTKDIGEYQNEMFRIAAEDPELSIIAAKTELALINRTADLIAYIYTNALLQDEMNLLNNKERMDMINYVVSELRAMRGLAYGITRKMRVARQAGILNTLNPYQIKYPDNSAKIVQDLLNDIRN